MTFTFMEKNFSKMLDEISDVISHEWPKEQDIGIFQGLGGITVFLYTMSRFTNQERYAEIADLAIYESVRRINNGYSISTYCSGLAGFGWTMEYLSENGIVDIDKESLLSNLDDPLYQKMTADFANGYFDFLHGGIGYALYFLKRYKNASIASQKEKFLQYLRETIIELGKLAITDEHGLKWSSPIYLPEKRMVYNLSLSHGMASIINYLCRLYKIAPFQAEITPLLQGAVNYIVHSRHNNGLIWALPIYVEEHDGSLPKGRLAWCYGDLGVTLSLLKAGEILRDEHLINLSLSILSNCQRLRDPIEAGVVDTNLCHGTFGLAHLFDHLDRLYPNHHFKETSDHWLATGIAMRKGKNSAGFEQWLRQEWMGCNDLLDGLSGIGLACLSLSGATIDPWDESMLIS
jgi:lantibiotic modifying enzyme